MASGKKMKCERKWNDVRLELPPNKVKLVEVKPRPTSSLPHDKTFLMWGCDVRSHLDDIGWWRDTD